MAAIDGKFNCKIGNFGFILAQMMRTERYAYSREEAPAFVNKFSSGEPNYRDSTFFPHWVQLNWQNGFDQEFFDDGGKFYRSASLNPTNVGKLTLERNFTSLGQLAAGIKITTQENFRVSAQSNSALYNDAALKAYYAMEGNSSDPKGSHNGTDTAITYSAGNGKFSQGAGLNGTTSKVVLTDHADFKPTGNFSVSLWLKTSVTGAQQGLFQSYAEGTGKISGWELRINTTNKVLFRIGKNTGSSAGTDYKDLVSTASVTDGNWHLIVAVWDGTNMNLYVDGASGVTPAAGFAAVYQATNYVRFGTENTAGTDGSLFTGALDEISLFSRTLTSTEIQTYYNTNAPLSASTPSQNIEIFGSSNGKVYSWDGQTTLTELFDARRTEWYETGNDADKVVGDTGGTETAQAQSFKTDAALKMKAVQIYLKKSAGTPGDITVTIETDNSAKPSGTKVDATNAVATIPAFTTATYGWITVEFPDAFALAATTTYWIVLKTGAAANDNNYSWAADASSPSYADGSMAASTNGGSTWSTVTASDAYFRVLGNITSINCMLLSDITGSIKLYIGTGNPEGVTSGDAKLFTYDGTTFALNHIFAGTDEAMVGAMLEFGSLTRTIYIGLGSQAKIYTTTDFTTFTLAKTITVPKNPGYILAMAEYNNRLYIGGGFPQNLPGTANQFNGFLYAYDEYTWINVFPFDHTVITSLETYDTLLFIGTIKNRLYVFNTASIDKLLDFPWDVTIKDMIKWDDKLILALTARAGTSATGNEGVYIFDRSGFHNAFNVSGKEWWSLGIFNNNLLAGSGDGYVYQTSFSTYISSGTLQTSYDEAQLPSIYKIRRDFTLMYEALPTGCTIQVEYKTDESDASWTNLGTASVVDSTETTFNFASGVYCKKISYRITLATSVPSSAPVLKKTIHKYVLSPDFKYLWKMKLLCADNMIWQDNTEPTGLLNAAVSAGDTSITLKSSDVAAPTAGFPDPSGSTMYASIITPSTGVVDTFSYTGKTGTTLTGIPATGDYALGSHSAGDFVRILGADLHRDILDLKKTKQLYTFTDIDGLTYTVLFYSYQADVWSINQNDLTGGLENEVPITLLEG